MLDLTTKAETQSINRSDKVRILAIVAGTIFLTLLPQIAVRIVCTEDGQSTNDAMVFVASPVLCAVLMIAISVLVIRRKPRWAAFDPVWARWTRSELAWFLVLPVAVIAVAIPFGLLHEKAGLPITRAVGFDREFYESRGLLVWLTVYGVLLAPVTEEIFWRGYVQSTLTRVFHPVTAVVTQAVLFGLIHCRPTLGTAAASGIGLVSGVWRWRRRTLVPVIIVHILCNSIAFSGDWTNWREVLMIRPVHDYTADFMVLSRPAGYEPNEDARQEYERAFHAVVAPTEQIFAVRNRYPDSWSDQERASIETWLPSNAEALRLMADGSRKPFYWPEYEPNGVALFTCPHGMEMRHLHVALNFRALARAAQGEYGDATDDIITCYRAACHLLQCKDAGFNLLGTALYGFASQTTRMILAHENISPKLLANLQLQLEELARRQPIRFDLRAERFFPLEMIQRLFTDDGRGGGCIPRCYFGPEGFSPHGAGSAIFEIAEAAGSDISQWRTLDRCSVTNDVESYYCALEQASAMAPWDYEQNMGNAKSDLEGISERDSFIGMLSPSPTLRYFPAKARADLDSVITILAVLRYKADRQELPENLEQLVVEGYLKDMPRDPFSSGPLIYSRSGVQFTLYSCGLDFDDDGGVPSNWGEGDNGGDQVFWPVSEEN